jgi:N-acetylmuramidase/Putative peptidoglycan binding domain
MATTFVGTSLALTEGGVTNTSAAIATGLPELWAVIAVETSGCGFLADRRPQILYERHIFHTLTRGRFDDGDISDRRPGGYGRRGAHQYARLAKALALNREAALKSASWGLGQILGRNFAMAGFPDVESFVRAMSDSEDAQLAAMGAFVASAGLGGALRARDWSAFARGYNGPAFARNRYDERLEQAHQRYVDGGLPDLRIRTAQVYLRYRGFNPGPIDGSAGRLTRAAVVDYQTREGLPPTGVIDDALITRLRPS